LASSWFCFFFFFFSLGRITQLASCYARRFTNGRVNAIHHERAVFDTNPFRIFNDPLVSKDGFHFCSRRIFRICTQGRKPLLLFEGIGSGCLPSQHL
jgi:hypothetical protein